MFEGLGLEPCPTFFLIVDVGMFCSELVVRWLSCCIQRASFKLCGLVHPFQVGIGGIIVGDITIHIVNDIYI
jgi:hypothetical protein